MLVEMLVLWLACPPTAEPRAGKPQQPQFVAHYYRPYGHDPFDAEKALPIASLDPPELPDLPLWNLDALWLELEQHNEGSDRPEWVAWTRWSVALALGRPATAHQSLLSALADDRLSPERLLWWRSLGPTSLDDRDAMVSAFERTSSPTARLNLSAALAVVHWELSCPVAIDVDGACRVPGSSALGAGQAIVGREPITLESARRWTRVAAKLRRSTKLGPDDLGGRALLAELDLLTLTLDYEQQLAARMPNDLEFGVDDWRNGSGVPAWERVYRQQVEDRDRSVARHSAFFASYIGCRRAQHEQHTELLAVEARLATRVLLREATGLLAEAAVFDELESPSEREWRRQKAETGGWRYQCWAGPTHSDGVRDAAEGLARRCVEIGTTLASHARVVAGCRAILDDVAGEPPMTELVPAPGSHPTMESAGVLGPDIAFGPISPSSSKEKGVIE